MNGQGDYTIDPRMTPINIGGNPYYQQGRTSLIDNKFNQQYSSQNQQPQLIRGGEGGNFKNNNNMISSPQQQQMYSQQKKQQFSSTNNQNYQQSSSFVNNMSTPILVNNSSLKTTTNLQESTISSSNNNDESSRSNSRIPEFDYGIKQNEETTHEITICLKWIGTLKEILEKPFSIVPADLISMLQPPIKNPDAILSSGDLESENKLNEGDLKKVFIGAVKIVKASISFEDVILGLRAEDPISDWNKLFLPNSVNVSEKVMLSINSRIPLTPSSPESIFDRTDILLKSKIFNSFGHVNYDDFKSDLMYLSKNEESVYGGSDKIKVKSDSALNQLIQKNGKYLISVGKWDGKWDVATDSGDYIYPMPTVAFIMIHYKKGIDSQKNKICVHDLSSGLKFKIVTMHNNTSSSDRISLTSKYESKYEENVLSTKGIIWIEIQLKYAFPKSVFGKYRKANNPLKTPQGMFAEMLALTFSENK